MKKHPGGRPTVITDVILQKLEEAFLLGCTDLEACFAADISKSTLYNYQNDHPEFVERKERLKANPVHLARLSVLDGMSKDPTLAFNYLKLKMSDEFSERKRLEVTGDPEKPLDFTFKITREGGE